MRFHIYGFACLSLPQRFPLSFIHMSPWYVCCGSSNVLRLFEVAITFLDSWQNVWDSPHSSFLTHIKQYIQVTSVTQFAATGNRYSFIATQRALCLAICWLYDNSPPLPLAIPNTWTLGGFCTDGVGGVLDPWRLKLWLHSVGRKNDKILPTAIWQFLTRLGWRIRPFTATTEAFRRIFREAKQTLRMAVKEVSVRESSRMTKVAFRKSDMPDLQDVHPHERSTGKSSRTLQDSDSPQSFLF